MDSQDWIDASIGIITAIGVIFAGWQLRAAKRQARTDFEDSLNRDYRETIRALPIGALLGDVLSEAELLEHLADFYRYVDLCNEQIFLRQKDRISTSTWLNWADGIKDNLRRPAFQQAWKEIRTRATDSFEELRKFEDDGFTSDPKKWA